MFAYNGRDNVDGGDGIDYIQSADGGDCLWGGASVIRATNGYPQVFDIYGTGLDEENYTIVMDFWREDAVAIGDG